MPYNNYNSGPGPGTTALLGGFIIVYLVVILAIVVFSVIVYWKIFSKAGYSGAMGLLMFVPIVNLVALCILAFGEWPIYRELNSLRQMARNQQFPQNPPFPQQQYQQYPQNPQFPQSSQYQDPNPQYRG